MVANFGREKILNVATFRTKRGAPVEPKLWGEQEGWMSTEVRYMHEAVGRKAEVLNGVSNWLAEALKEKYFGKDAAFAPFEKVSMVCFSFVLHLLQL